MEPPLHDYPSCQATVIPLCFEEEDEEGAGRTCDEDHGTTTTSNRKITFSRQVSVIDIPSRDSYSVEERASLWMPTQDLKKLTQKNMIEFAAEGWFWKNVVEEDGMVLGVDGTLTHPIHLNPMLKEALRRQIPYPRAVTPPDEDMLMRDARIMMESPPPEDPIDRPSSPFVETVIDQEYSTEQDDMLLVEADPDEYLRRRFAHHHNRKPRNSLAYGDSDDYYVTQMLYLDPPQQQSHRRRKD